VCHASLGKERSSEKLGGQPGQGGWVRRGLIVEVIVSCRRRQEPLYVTVMLTGMDARSLPEALWGVLGVLWGLEELGLRGAVTGRVLGAVWCRGLLGHCRGAVGRQGRGYLLHVGALQPGEEKAWG